jgi:hypothetical protein
MCVAIKRACPARVSAEVDRSTKVISKPTTPTPSRIVGCTGDPQKSPAQGTGLEVTNVMVASRLLVGVGDALDSARANAELLGDLVQPWATRSSQCITDAPFQLGVDEGPTAVLATGLGPSNARIHPLADHRALELGEDAHHLEHGLARRRRGVDALLMQEQVDAQAVQLGEEAAEVLQRAAEAIDGPCHDDIKPAPSRVLVHGIEAGTLIPALRARDARIPIHSHDLVPDAFCGSPKLALLVLGGLLVGGNPKVDRCPHGSSPLHLMYTDLALFCWRFARTISRRFSYSLMQRGARSSKGKPGVRLSEHIAHPNGASVFHHACKLGAEGIVSKRLGSRYRSGRSPDWLKFKNRMRLR